MPGHKTAGLGVIQAHARHSALLSSKVDINYI
jgi:hypothetical protein